MARVQEVLASRYELLEVLGRGGMGVVYRARDRVLQRVVAVKVLPLDRAQDPASVARFEREALAAAGLSHRNIVAIYDSGTDEETRFIVMEYLTGRSLAELVHDGGALDAEQAVDIAAQVAAALAAAHRAGIVHRDIKPANVMVDENGHVKVLDFGIARLTAGISLTQTATVLGSAPYLAPELCRGAPADARSDIYALGCVLYELLTGQAPFSGEVPAAVVHQQISATPRSPAQLNPAVPAALSSLTLAMLAKEPGQRPQDAGNLVVALPETLIGPASEAHTTRIASADAATTQIAGDVAATIPLGFVGAAAGAGAAADLTRVMPGGSGLPPLGNRRNALIAGAIVLLLAIVFLAMAATSGAPGHPAAGHRSTVRTTPTHTATTTTPTTSTTTTQKTQPGASGPPAGRAGGPHKGGLPPGQAKKQGDGQGQNGD